MPVWIVMVIMAVLAAILIVVFAYSAHNGRRMRETADYAQDAAPLQRQQATVAAKTTRRGETGTLQVPSHRILYLVEFRTQDGGRVVLEVDEPDYELFEQGAQDTLITQNGRFVGFGEIGSV